MPNSSAEGLARSLLSSFTVATTPPPRSSSKATRVAAELAEEPPQPESQSRQESSRGDAAATTSQDNRQHTGEEEEEPRPSIVAPRPAPAPSSSSSLNASTDVPAAKPASSATLPASSWQPGWKASSWSASRQPASVAASSGGVPFSWRSSRLETPLQSLPCVPSHSPTRSTISGIIDTSLTCASESGGFTPKIRYRASSSDVPPRASAFASPSRGPHYRSSEAAHHRDVNRSPLHALEETQRRTSSLEPRAVRPDTALTPSQPIGILSTDSSFRPRTHVAPTPSAAGASATAPPVTGTTAPAPAPSFAKRRTPAARQGKASPPTVSQTRPGTTVAPPSRLPAGLTTKSVTAGLAVAGASTSVSFHPSTPHYQRGLTGKKGGAVEATATTAAAPPPSSRVSVADVWSRQPLEATIVPRSENDSVDDNMPDANASDSDALSYRSGDSLAEDAALGTEPFAFGHLTLRSLTEEYNQFSSDGSVGWVGLQVHLRRHTQSPQVRTLDLTCYRMQRGQWSWFALDILPQLQSLEVLRLAQMSLGDDEVAELARGCCGFASHADGTRTSSTKRTAALGGSPPPSSSRAPSSSAAATAIAATESSAPLRFLRVLDLSGNAVTQRSCSHLGKMLLCMADSLEELRLLGNPLKDYGLQVLAVYVAKLNVEALEHDPDMFSGSLRHQYRLLREQQQQQRQQQQEHLCEEDVLLQNEEKHQKELKATLESLPLGLVLLDLRDCRASARGISDILAAASRAHRLSTLILSHNAPGVTALQPLPTGAYREALDVASETSAASESARHKRDDSRSYRAGPLPRRLRLTKTALLTSGALLRRQHACFSDVAGFAAACAMSTLVFHSVPLSQTFSPVGCRELLLNVFFSCPRLNLVDLSDTFEWSLVPPEACTALVAEAMRRDAVEQRLRGPEVQRGLQIYREDQGEVGFALDSTAVAGQTRLGDICGELMAHAAYNALVRQRLVPAAFAHLRELHLSNSGLTDAGVRGLCVSVRRGRSQTGMLAALTVLNLSDNLLTTRGCLRVICAFLLEDAWAEAMEGAAGEEREKPNATPHVKGSSTDAEVLKAAASQPLPVLPRVPIAQLTALALQRNAGVDEDEDFDADRISGYVTDGSGVSPSVNANHVKPSHRADDDSSAYLREVCTAAETAVLRRAMLQSVARGDARGSDGIAPLTVYFSAPPLFPLQVPDGVPPQQRRRQERRPSRHARMTVYYAGCDERGDVFCTCPRSRLYVSTEKEQEAERAAAAALAEIQNATSAAPAEETAEPGVAQAESAPNVAVKVHTNGASRSPSLLPTPHPRQQQLPPRHVAAQSNLLATLDVPRPGATGNSTNSSWMRHRSGSAGGATTPDVQLPHPATPFLLPGAAEDANGLVNSTSLYAQWVHNPNVQSHHASSQPNSLGGGGAASSYSSLSFPPLPSPSVGSEAAAAQWGDRQQPSQPQSLRVFHPLALQDARQQQQQQQQPARDRLLSVSGGSLGTLFMEKNAETSAGAVAAQSEMADVMREQDTPAASQTPKAAEGVTTYYVPSNSSSNYNNSGNPVAPEGTGNAANTSGENPLNLARRPGKRRAKPRHTRTFILSYDHPPGHLLCRAFAVLSLPPPNAFGAEARATLDADLLRALQRTTAEAYNSAVSDDYESEGRGEPLHFGSNTDGEERGLLQTPPRGAVTVDGVRYLPPDTPSTATGAIAKGDGDAPPLARAREEAHQWMRFEITTNERKAHMAQRLQEVLNVSWATQCVCFAQLLQWLRAHVRLSDIKVQEEPTVEMAAWDPVQAIERAARASSTVRTKLETLYGGSSVMAVHAHHTDAISPDALYGASGQTPSALPLVALHRALWTQLGLLRGLENHRSRGKLEALVEQQMQAPSSLPQRAAPKSVTTIFAVEEEKEGEKPSREYQSALPVLRDRPGAAEEKAASAALPLSRFPVMDLYGAAENVDAPEQRPDKARDDDGKRQPEPETSQIAPSQPPSPAPVVIATAASVVAALGPNAAQKASKDDRGLITDSLAPSLDQRPSRHGVVPQPGSTMGTTPAASGSVSNPINSSVRKFRNLDGSSDDDNEASTSIETPEKQQGVHERRRSKPGSPPHHLAETPLASGGAPEPAPQQHLLQQPSQLGELEKQAEEEKPPPQEEPEVSDEQLLLPPLLHSAPLQPAEAEDDNGPVLTDQLMAPLSLSDVPLRRRKEEPAAPQPYQTKTSVRVGEKGSSVEVEEDWAGNEMVDAPIASSPPQENPIHRGRSKSASYEVSDTTPRSRPRMHGTDDVPVHIPASPPLAEQLVLSTTLSEEPLSPPHGTTAVAKQEHDDAKKPDVASPPAATATVTAETTASQAKGVESEKADDGENNEMEIPPPIRVRRHPSQLEGRVKTFTLSYTHQEGTAVCRAWRLLHFSASNSSTSPNGNDDAGDGVGDVASSLVAPVSPTSAAYTLLAQEARDYLCDDFLALLQPPDDDMQHVVLSVSLQGDGVAATAMLQVQVQTNERRATLANRLQESNHGVRRGAGSGGNGLEPLTVEQVDQFYFPRLTGLLRRHKLVADTVAQVSAFLMAHLPLQGRLVKSYGSVTGFVHYYHGSATALEHELGISSWDVLTKTDAPEPPPPPPSSSPPLPHIKNPAQTGTPNVGVRPDGQVEMQSPMVAKDRVSPQGDDAQDRDAFVDERSTGESPRELSRGKTIPPLKAPSDPATAFSGGNGANNVQRDTPVPSVVQGRPPPHPRRPPTPPHPITHTDSISFDEVTEEPTSEAGPIVVLRGSTASVTSRPASSLNAQNPQYYPAGFRAEAAAAAAAASGNGDGYGDGPTDLSQTYPSPVRRPQSNEAGRRDGPDLEPDSNAVSPLTSRSASPVRPVVGGRIRSFSPVTSQLNLEGEEGNDSPVRADKLRQSPPKEKRSNDGTAAPVFPSVMTALPTPSQHTPSSSPPTGALNPTVSLRESKSVPEPPPPPRPRPDHPQLPLLPASSSHAPPQQQQQQKPLAPPPAASAAPSSPHASRSQHSGNAPPPPPPLSTTKSEYERVLEGKHKRLMRVAYDGVARGSVPLDPQHQQKTVIGRGKWGSQKVELSLEWEILFVVTFEKSHTLGRSSRRAQMLVHPVGCGFECMSGDEVNPSGGDVSSLHSSMVNAITAEGSGVFHPPAPSQASKTSRYKKEKSSSKSAASHLIIIINRPFGPDEVGSSMREMEQTLLAGAALTVSSKTSLSKAARLLGGSDDASNASRGSNGTRQAAQDLVDQLCQRSLTMDIEMKDTKHVQEALRLLKNSIRRATQAVKKSMLNAHIAPSPSPTQAPSSIQPLERQR